MSNNMRMTFEELNILKKLYIKMCSLKNKKKYIDEIMLYYLNNGAGVELLEFVSEVIEIDVYSFGNVLDFHYYLSGYDFITNELITTQQRMSIDINLIDLDEDGNIIENDKRDDIQEFELYKKLFR